MMSLDRGIPDRLPSAPAMLVNLHRQRFDKPYHKHKAARFRQSEPGQTAHSCCDLLDHPFCVNRGFLRCMLSCIFLYNLLRRTALPRASSLRQPLPSCWAHDVESSQTPPARFPRSSCKRWFVSNLKQPCPTPSLQHPSSFTATTVRSSGDPCKSLFPEGGLRHAPPSAAAAYASQASASDGVPDTDPLPDSEPAAASQLVAAAAAAPTDINAARPPSPRRIFIFDAGEEALDPSWTISQLAWDMASLIQPIHGPYGKRAGPSADARQPEHFEPTPSQRSGILASRDEPGGKKSEDASGPVHGQRLAPAAAAAAHEQAALHEDFLTDTAWSHTYNAKPQCVSNPQRPPRM